MLLVSCGGGGGSSASSSGFAPADADAFETKFVNQTITALFDGGSDTIMILNDKMIKFGSDENPQSYTYTNISANSIRIVELDTDNCTDVFVFTSELAGTFTSTCPGEVLTGTFTFSGSN